MKSSQQSMKDRVRKRAETHKSRGGLDTLALPEGVELFKPEKGTIEFDIIPYKVTADNHPEVKKGEIWYERTYMSHRNVGPEEKAIICPRTIGKRCPICEEYQKLNKDPNADEDVVKGLRAKERELFNVVMKDGDGEVMVLNMSVHLFGLKLEQEILEGDEGNASFAELKGGKTLKVRWEQKSMGTAKFVEAGRIDFKDRDDLDEDTLDAAVDLDKAMKILSYEEIEKIFQAGGDEADEGKAGKEEEAEEEEEEEKEEKPAKRKIGGNRKSAKKKEEDDDQDDDDDDQIPGLEIPAKGKAKPKEDDNDNECIACDGTGKNSKGAVCKVCKGTGKMDDDGADAGDDDSDEDEDEEEVKPKKKTRTIGRKIKR